MLQAFKENGIAYLLKPILKEDLAHALDKLERLKGLSSENQASARMENRRWRQRLLIVNGDQYSFVNVSEIAYLLSEDKYVFAILKSGKRQLTEIGSLADALPCLDRHQFFQTARNLIINIESIEKVVKHFNGRLKVILSVHGEKTETMVSAARKHDFLEWMGGKP